VSGGLSEADLGEHAAVRLLESGPTAPIEPAGPLGSAQEAELTMAPEALARLWRPQNLERLARAYWRYLTRVSLGALRVVYGADSRRVVLVHPRLVLLRFRAPDYRTEADFGQVTWPIERGLLVARPGQGHLRISVRRLDDRRVLVRSEVENFYPLLRGYGRFARLGARFYGLTQLRLHVLLTRGFLRSLARLDLPAPRSEASVAD
jgi:hypothetical protein